MLSELLRTRDPEDVETRTFLNSWNKIDMARMHPEDIEGLKSTPEGERKVFRFLREAARPDQDFIGGYEPAIGEEGKEPDFVLFGKQQGLLVREVKDWLVDQIEEADPIECKGVCF